MFEPNRPGDILIVEDNDDDFEATERAFRKIAGFSSTIHRCRDGREAWSFLADGKDIRGNPVASPSLVMLDLNMPGLDGRKLLKRLKDHPQLSVIPVVILSTSSDQLDVEGCYDAGANTYIPKPVSWKDFSDIIQSFHEYWFDLAMLPKPES